MQDDVLLAYQLCFDLFENESQAFNFKVRPFINVCLDHSLCQAAARLVKNICHRNETGHCKHSFTNQGSTQVTGLLEQSAPKRPGGAEPNGHTEAGGTAHNLPNGHASSAPAPGAAPAVQNGAAAHAEDMQTEEAAPSAQAAPVPSLKPEEELYLERFGRLRGILDGTMSISYYLEFLYSHNHADLQVGPLQPSLATHPQEPVLLHWWVRVLQVKSPSTCNVAQSFMCRRQVQSCAASLRIPLCCLLCSLISVFGPLK